ncbi:MAG TPA: DUF3300 domain-containing protein, partial [Sulfuricaulis sp.]|nr:DUF3300 domain-containing protein [Sulfuricaulis sp.]
MKPMCLQSCMLALAMLVAASPDWAQQRSAPPVPAATSASAKTFSQQELDQILAPIALYPDALLAQIFMASTYPLEIVEAARWVKANPKLKDKALEDALQKQAWDPSVKSLTTVPQVLEQMNDKLDWTQKLGDAFLAQQKEVMSTVQTLRAKAKAAGNLESTGQQVVKSETEDGQTIYMIESPQPDVIYVPTYDPTVVYGVWWYPYPPYYMYPPHYVYPPHVAFTAGIIVGAAIWGNCNWHGGNVNVHVEHYNSFNRTNINNPDWNHNVDHRKGVPYKDQKVAERYNRGRNDKAAQSREDFRGRADAGRAELQDMDRNELQNRAAQADRDRASQRAPTAYDRASS